jgi:hypothetical protein
MRRLLRIKRKRVIFQNVVCPVTLESFQSCLSFLTQAHTLTKTAIGISQSISKLPRYFSHSTMKVLYISMLLLATSSKSSKAFQLQTTIGGLISRNYQPLYAVCIAAPRNSTTTYVQVDEEVKEQIKAAALSLDKVKPATNVFYSVLELITALGAVVGVHGMVPFSALLVSIKATESTIHSLGKASVLSEEVPCFQRSLEVVKESVESTLEECS